MNYLEAGYEKLNDELGADPIFCQFIGVEKMPPITSFDVETEVFRYIQPIEAEEAVPAD